MKIPVLVFSPCSFVTMLVISGLIMLELFGVVELLPKVLLVVVALIGFCAILYYPKKGKKEKRG